MVAVLTNPDFVRNNKLCSETVSRRCYVRRANLRLEYLDDDIIKIAFFTHRVSNVNPRKLTYGGITTYQNPINPDQI